jgi:Domain of unknown function (DUF397)
MMGTVRSTHWKKSSRCDSSACVEVAQLEQHVGVRDSKDPDGPVLTFSSGAWSSFVAGVRAGDFEGHDWKVTA